MVGWQHQQDEMGAVLFNTRQSCQRDGRCGVTPLWLKQKPGLRGIGSLLEHVKGKVKVITIGHHHAVFGITGLAAFNGLLQQ